MAVLIGMAVCLSFGVVDCQCERKSFETLVAERIGRSTIAEKPKVQDEEHSAFPQDAVEASVTRRICEQRPDKAGKAVLGRLDKEKIAKVIHAKRNGVKSCVASVYPGGKGLIGKLKLSFVISEDGTVCDVSPDIGHSEATVKEISRYERLENCVIGVAQEMVFPPPDGGVVTVTYPFMHLFIE